LSGLTILPQEGNVDGAGKSTLSNFNCSVSLTVREKSLTFAAVDGAGKSTWSNFNYSLIVTVRENSLTFAAGDGAGRRSRNLSINGCHSSN